MEFCLSPFKIFGELIFQECTAEYMLTNFILNNLIISTGLSYQIVFLLIPVQKKVL